MEPFPGRTRHAGVVIPIRAFTSGNVRLADALDPDGRAVLARTMAETVVAAAGVLPVLVVTSAPEVLAWADARAISTLADPGTGLDGAAAAGRDELRRQGFARTVVAHADLPRAGHGTLARLGGTTTSVTIVPCHRDDGTPVLVVPNAADFRFAYGPASAAGTQPRRRRLGLAVRVVRDPDLGYDVDVPSDLAGVANPS